MRPLSNLSYGKKLYKSPIRLTARTSDFQSGNTGSIPVWVTIIFKMVLSASGLGHQTFNLESERIYVGSNPIGTTRFNMCIG